MRSKLHGRWMLNNGENLSHNSLYSYSSSVNLSAWSRNKRSRCVHTEGLDLLTINTLGKEVGLGEGWKIINLIADAETKNEKKVAERETEVGKETTDLVVAWDFVRVSGITFFTKIIYLFYLHGRVCHASKQWQYHFLHFLSSASESLLTVAFRHSRASNRSLNSFSFFF